MARRNSQTKSDDLCEPVDAPEALPAPVPMDFNVWFSLFMAANPKFLEWQRPQLRAFMRCKGLSDRENKASYDKAFEQF